MYKEKINENVWVIDNFLSKSECDFHMKASELKGYEMAKVNIDGKQTVMTSVRNNQRVLTLDNDLAQELWERLSPFIDEYPFAKPIGLNEMFRYYKYVPGERFKMHRDGSYKRHDSEQSFLTLIIYLNEDFEGGATGFMREFDIEPKIGRAVIFDHKVRHEGKNLEQGTKYVLRTDVMFQVVLE